MRTFIVSILILITLNSYSQTAVLEKYDFNSGSYTIYFTRWSEGFESVFLNEMKYFYINDTTALNQLKTEWVLPQGNLFLCGYDYEIYIVKNDSLLGRARLNTECNSLGIGGEYYYIDQSKIDLLRKDHNKLILLTKAFSGVKTARKFYKKIAEDASYFIPQKYEEKWIDFDGYTIYSREFVVRGRSSNDSLIDIIKGEINGMLSKREDRYKLTVSISSSGLGKVGYRILIYSDEPIRNNLSSDYVEEFKWTKYKDVKLMYYQKKDCL